MVNGTRTQGEPLHCLHLSGGLKTTQLIDQVILADQVPGYCCGLTLLSLIFHLVSSINTRPASSTLPSLRHHLRSSLESLPFLSALTKIDPGILERKQEPKWRNTKEGRLFIQVGPVHNALSLSGAYSVAVKEKLWAVFDSRVRNQWPPCFCIVAACSTSTTYDMSSSLQA